MHTCSFYCHDGLHVSKALLHPVYATGEIVKQLYDQCIEHHRQVIEAKPAREADVIQ